MSLDRKNELDIVQVRGDLKLIAQKVDNLKNNDLHHIQLSINNINRILLGVGLLILGQLFIAIGTVLVG
jgi:hypothetical protein|tara:strand:- start:46 stop:252 length:207 start_codon:yes stop_codon:yes gene_type:complete